MKNVLIVSYRCPPDNCIGALRITKMLKYLPQFGYQPYLLGGGVKNDCNPYVFKPSYFDPFLFGKKCRDAIQKSLNNNNNHNGKSSEIIKDTLKYNQPKGLWPLSESRMPDKYMFWILPAIRLGKRLLEKQKFDIIYSSSGPVSSAIVASKLQNYSNLPWVAEFRDPWSDSQFDLRKGIIGKIDPYLEKKFLQNASAFITVTDSFREKMLEKYNKKTYVIYNGYDDDDYPKQVELTKKFTITYTGMLYPGRRDPTPLFEAIANLDRAKNISSDTFQIRFFGKEQADIVKPLIAKYGIENYVYLGGTIPYKECLLKQSESWLLLLLEWNNPLDRGILTISGKFFEYLGSKRPIFAICYEKGTVSDILAKTGSGVILNNPKDIEKFLISCLDKYSKNNKSLGFTIKDDAIASYSRRNSAEQLSGIFNILT